VYVAATILYVSVSGILQSLLNIFAYHKYQKAYYIPRKLDIKKYEAFVPPPTIKLDHFIIEAKVCSSSKWSILLNYIFIE